MDKIIVQNSLQLMDEVRRDAFKKSGNAEQREQLFRLIDRMLKLLKTVCNNGILALEDKAKEILRDTNS